MAIINTFTFPIGLIYFIAIIFVFLIHSILPTLLIDFPPSYQRLRPHLNLGDLSIPFLLSLFLIKEYSFYFFVIIDFSSFLIWIKSINNFINSIFPFSSFTHRLRLFLSQTTPQSSRNDFHTMLLSKWIFIIP